MGPPLFIRKREALDDFTLVELLVSWCRAQQWGREQRAQDYQTLAFLAELHGAVRSSESHHLVNFHRKMVEQVSTLRTPLAAFVPRELTPEDLAFLRPPEPDGTA